MAEALITCTTCKKRTPMSQMRYSPDGEDLMCQACFSSMTGGAKPAASTVSNAGRMASRSSSVSSVGSSSYGSSFSSRPAAASTSLSSASKPVRYQCMSCNYKFSRASKNEAACPYCNRKTLRKEFQLTSDVDELMGSLGPY